jgi:branched-chain amino acid transport system ATP-binding protein
MALLDVAGLEVRYGRIRGTNDVSFAVEAGEVVALVGANGAGKSSTLKAILGMAARARGQIMFQGKSLAGVKTSEAVRRGIGYSPEGRRVFPHLSVIENLRVGGYISGADAVGERMEQMFGYFPRLRERGRQLAGSLSGGEQQMLAIGRALMSRPRLFLLDEPSLGLAPIVVERIGDIVLEVQEREGLAVVLAEQNAGWAMGLAQRAVILELGRTIVAGDAEELMEDPKVRTAYLGI